MEVRLLRYFLMIAREESITKAAEALYITQPTLSRQIASLEEELGVVLIIRGGNKKIMLTDAGVMFRRRAEEIVELVDKTLFEMSKFDDELSGIISIGAAESFSAQILSDIIQIFNNDYPNVKFDIFSNNAENIKERIDKGLADFGILIEPTDISKYDCLRLKETERWGLLVKADSSLAKNEYITKNDLFGIPLFNSKQAERSEIAKWFGKDYEKVNTISTYNLINNAAMLVEKGLGSAIVIDGAIALYKNDNLKFIPFKPELKNTSVLVWKKLQPLNAQCKKFLELAKMLVEHNLDAK